MRYTKCYVHVVKLDLDYLCTNVRHCGPERQPNAIDINVNI